MFVTNFMLSTWNKFGRTGRGTFPRSKRNFFTAMHRTTSSLHRQALHILATHPLLLVRIRCHACIAARPVPLFMSMLIHPHGEAASAFLRCTGNALPCSHAMFTINAPALRVFGHPLLSAILVARTPKPTFCAFLRFTAFPANTTTITWPVCFYPIPLRVCIFCFVQPTSLAGPLQHTPFARSFMRGLVVQHLLRKGIDGLKDSTDDAIVWFPVASIVFQTLFAIHCMTRRPVPL